VEPLTSRRPTVLAAASLVRIEDVFTDSPLDPHDASVPPSAMAAQNAPATLERTGVRTRRSSRDPH
jgi:hypothetical protein